MKMTLEENEMFAETVLKPMLSIVDVACFAYDVEKLKGTLETMKEQTGYVAAWPFPETMEKAEDLKHMNNLMEKVIELLIARHEQRSHAMEDKPNSGVQVLKRLGF